MKNVYTVRQVNSYVKQMFTQDFVLQRIYVKGEVSNCKYHSSGHIYFSLKDSSGTIACVMFAGQRKGLAFRMHDGQEVVVLGNINVYERDGKYQLYASSIVLDGAGLLYEKFQALKKELEEMGMFAPEYKKPIPSYVRKVGIVTASTGAAIRDIVNISHRRNPYVQLILYPAIVQGEYAVPSIVRGIRTLDDRDDIDVIIVGRGGGSIEDLWAFNEEEVARAIFECVHPVISAVGHETDFTIADFVADLRAPTPSAAAELAVFEIAGYEQSIRNYRDRMQLSLRRKITKERGLLESYAVRFRYLNPKVQIQTKRQMQVEYESLLRKLMEDRLKDYRYRMGMYAEILHGRSPLLKFTQGFSYVSDAEGHTIRSLEDVHAGDDVTIAVRDGYIDAKVTGVRKEHPDGRE